MKKELSACTDAGPDVFVYISVHAWTYAIFFLYHIINMCEYVYMRNMSQYTRLQGMHCMQICSYVYFASFVDTQSDCHMSTGVTSIGKLQSDLGLLWGAAKSHHAKVIMWTVRHFFWFFAFIKVSFLHGKNPYP